MLAGGEQGSTPPSPLCSRSRMMCVINPTKHRGRGLHEVIPLRRTVVCQGQGARLRTAVMLFSVLSVVSGGWLSVSGRGAEPRTAVWGMFGWEANLSRGGAASVSLRSSERRASAVPASIADGPTLYVVVSHVGDWAACLRSCIPALLIAVLDAVGMLYR